MEKRVLVKKDVEKRIHKEGAKRHEKKVAEKEEAARSADKRASQKGLQNMRASQTRGRGDEGAELCSFGLDYVTAVCFVNRRFMSVPQQFVGCVRVCIREANDRLGTPC